MDNKKSLLEKAPQEIKDLIIEEVTRWQHSKQPIKNQEEAFNYIKESTEYSLRMLWLGRNDKLNQRIKEALNWISLSYLPKELNYDFYKVKQSEVQFSNKNHHELAQKVLEQVWNDYLLLEDNSILKPPVEKPSSFFKKIFKIK